jgi:predicted Rdx family selenoprotein
MSDDADVLNKLSRLLETQSIGTDGESTQELVAKISSQMDGVSVTSGSGGNFLSSTNKPSVMMHNRKTPYEGE